MARKILTVFFMLGAISLPGYVMAWTWHVHDYLCLEGLDCRLADYEGYQKQYNYGDWPGDHYCYDNDENCLPRLMAKYFVKKFYVEGQKDLVLLDIVVHLLQDSDCPDHWYPIAETERLGQLRPPFTPSWVGKVELQVEDMLRRGKKGWNIPIKFRGKMININSAYLEQVKEDIDIFLRREPKEGLEEIKVQIEEEKIWHNLRGLKEWGITAGAVGLIITIPILLIF